MSCGAGRPASAPVGARWGFPARPAAPVMGEALRFGPENGFSSRNRSRVPGNPGTSPSEPGGSHPAAAIAGRILSVRPQAFTPGSARIPNYKLSTKTGQAQTASTPASSCGTATTADRRMILFRHPASLLRRTEPLQTALIAAAFWTLAVIALTNLRDLHLGGLPPVEGVVARATMVCCVFVSGLVGARCVTACRKSGSFVPVRTMLGGTPGMLLFGAVASYLAIGASATGVEAIREPDTAGFWNYQVLSLGVLAAAAIGGRAVLERTGAERLLQGVLVVLIVSCAVILASPVLRDLGILAAYRIPFRLTGAFLDPNEASLAACMTVALAAALLTNGGARKLGWLGVAAGTAASLATVSRTALVVLGALAVVFLWINIRSKPKTLVLALAATGLIGIAVFAGVVGFSGGFSEWSRLRSTPVFVHEGSLFCDPSPTGNPGADCAVLLATRDILAGDMALNWSRAVSVYDWRGVTVDGPGGRVTGLDLARLRLNGRIPPDIGRLDRLVSLSLQRNRLSGRIPPELGELASLEHLNLNYNALTGGIPPELAKLGNLEELWLKNNRLTGPVPAALGEFDPSVLRLSGNDFDSIPPELAAVADHDLADMPSPARYDDSAVLLAVKDTLAGNAPLNWHAAVPVGLWQGVTMDGFGERVTGLDLAGLGLNGRIPLELGNLARLEDLNLSDNTLTGVIPPELGRLTALRTLRLAGNALTGRIPPELGRLTELRTLRLAGNALTGRIPPELGGLDFLFFLRLAGNDFHGCAPRELRHLGSHDIDDGFICAALAIDRRLMLWRSGFEKAMEAPIFGHGFMASRSLDGVPIGRDGKSLGAHNLYLMLLVDAGIIPLLAFVSAIVLLLRAQWSAPRSLARDATVAGVIVIALYSMPFQHLFDVSAFMFLAGLTVATGMPRHDGDRHLAEA